MEKNELFLENKRLYESGQDIPFCQIPMPEKELNLFYSSVCRKAKDMCIILFSFLIISLTFLIFIFIHFLNPPVSYIFVMLVILNTVLVLLTLKKDIIESNRLLNIYNNPTENHGLKTLTVKSDTIKFNSSDKVQINGASLHSYFDLKKLKIIAENHGSVQIYFYEKNKNHNLVIVYATTTKNSP